MIKTHKKFLIVPTPFVDGTHVAPASVVFRTLFALILLVQSLEAYSDAASMVNQIMPYYKPAQVNYIVEDVQASLEKIKEAYKNSAQDYTDGVRIDGAGWWFLVR